MSNCGSAALSEGEVTYKWVVIGELNVGDSKVNHLQFMTVEDKMNLSRG